jgi:hypothetical protein
MSSTDIALIHNSCALDLAANHAASRAWSHRLQTARNHADFRASSPSGKKEFTAVHYSLFELANYYTML